VFNKRRRRSNNTLSLLTVACQLRIWLARIKVGDDLYCTDVISTDTTKKVLTFVKDHTHIQDICDFRFEHAKDKPNIKILKNTLLVVLSEHMGISSTTGKFKNSFHTSWHFHLQRTNKFAKILIVSFILPLNLI